MLGCARSLPGANNRNPLRSLRLPRAPRQRYLSVKAQSIELLEWRALISFLFNEGVRRRRWLQIVFGRRTVHVPAKSKSDKTRHHQPGSGYHHPMRIFHLEEHVISPSPSALDVPNIVQPL
jgi:hypothetical protein